MLATEDSARQVPRARPRPIRRLREKLPSELDIATRLYDEFNRLISESRSTGNEVLVALGWVCEDYDRQIEELSLSWAPIQQRALSDSVYERRPPKRSGKEHGNGKCAG